MIVAGRTYRLTLTDGRALDVRPLTGDELAVERESKTSLSRLFDQSPSWALLQVLHHRLRRDAADVPESFEDFADLVDDLEVVDEGKAAGTARDRDTG